MQLGRIDEAHSPARGPDQASGSGTERSLTFVGVTAVRAVLGADNRPPWNAPVCGHFPRAELLPGTVPGSQPNRAQSPRWRATLW